jgi:hypothetical protein
MGKGHFYKTAQLIMSAECSAFIIPVSASTNYTVIARCYLKIQSCQLVAVFTNYRDDDSRNFVLFFDNVINICEHCDAMQTFPGVNEGNSKS